jgi:ABC-type transporter Mla MlaB component
MAGSSVQAVRGRFSRGRPMSSRPPDGHIGMTATFEVGAAHTRADIPALCAALAASFSDGDVVCDVSAVTRPDIVTVELLTRLALTARRLGGQLTIAGARPELRDLLDLLGLSDTLPDA